MNRRLKDLRSLMKENGIDYYIVTGSDPHHSEYPPDRWRTREWLTGFTGSAGTVVITADQAGLWTDSRYYIQAEKELDGSGFNLFKTGLPGVPGFLEWIESQLTPEEIIGSNMEVTTVDEEKEILKITEKKEAGYLACEDLLDEIWQDRPGFPDTAVFSFGVEYSGRSRKDKLADIRNKMGNIGADWYLVSSLPDIAWITNLRGGDIEYNPLFLSYLLIGKEEAVLFIAKDKIDSSIENSLRNDGITLESYDSVFSYLERIDEGAILLAPEVTSLGVYYKVRDRLKVVFNSELSADMKAVKNRKELEGFRSAMIKDGVAMVRFLFWFEKNWERVHLTEYTAAEKLTEFRSSMEGFMGPSFETISGFRDHGAIVHYSAEEETAYQLDCPGILLLDSGGHYLEGTTDITRVIPLGDSVEKDVIRDYTLVLQGHVNLAATLFPEGTCGVQLDVLARKPLWDEGENYLHGTGHGVGHFLPVHEGPVSISTKQPSVPLKKGMVVSDEPGIYREGKYGIRIENLVAVEEADKFPGEFCRFETLTLCPYERELIDVAMLTNEQIKWINEYHGKVYEKLSPYLNGEENQWLLKKTEELKPILKE